MASTTDTHAPATELLEGEALLVSVVMPCLNEAENDRACIARARDARAAGGIPGEVIVADNGSTDGTPSSPGRTVLASCTWRSAATAPRIAGASPPHGATSS